MQTKPSENKKRNLWGIIISVVINILIVAYIAFHEFGKSGADAPKFGELDINLRYLLLAAACFGVALLMETLKYRTMIKDTEGVRDNTGAFECAALGKYYDNITPLGAGGQPFQIMYLKSRGYSTGSAAAMPIAGFVALQTAFAFIAAVVFIFNSSVTENVAAIRITAYVGLAFYLFIPVCIVLFAIIPNTFSKMVCAGAKLLNKMHIVKDYDKAVSGIFSSMNEYTDSLKTISAHPRLVIEVVVYSIIYQVAVLSIPFFVLRAFGGTNDWWTVFSMVVFVYAAITIIPTPGNAGAAEGSFYAVFSSLTSAYLFWAMIIWRLLCYYSWLALGLVLVTKSAATPKRRRLRLGKRREQNQ